MVRKDDFNRKVPLPPGLTITAIQKAIDYIEKGLSELIEIYLEQSNVFSAIVGICGVKALDATSVCEKHRHQDLAQQRFPDLRKKGSGPSPAPMFSLESKASKRAWAIQSHYDHSGWYIVWRYLVDPTMSLESNKPVIIWRVDVVFLNKEDWKYEASSAGLSGGGRTHTFGIKNPAAKLKGTAIYQRSDVKLSGGKAVPANGD